jgi:hypothetical protein
MDAKLQCAECGREPRDDENADDECRAGSDGVGELHVFCPERWEWELGENAATRRSDEVVVARRLRVEND